MIVIRPPSILADVFDGVDLEVPSRGAAPGLDPCAGEVKRSPLGLLFGASFVGHEDVDGRPGLGVLLAGERHGETSHHGNVR